MPSDRYTEVALAEKQRLFDEVKADPRYKTYLYGCYECGICVAACPSARFYDFSPRKIAQTLAREDVELFYEQLNDDVWNCSQCFSCNRCPRQNSPGGLITIMREVAVKNGLRTTKEALAGYTRIIYKIMTTGTQVSPDMLQEDAFPDWGPQVKAVSQNLDVWRRALPPETLHTTGLSWQVEERTMHELYAIWKMTGTLDMIGELDEGLHDIMEEIMDDALEESGLLTE
ncbi:4Fe-4S dicluster domain-containing protein [Sulfobacillus thermosulfidooxidans]|uniref:4Fe-4S dicluster domain-containing protein n=1 Tax=Sulfobacillus thermosulfidooxidans TaxID=28034 RepID=UPI00096BAAB4|nr:4Fe-4S dicluster domain-containing protein [Sulfobacillus thermosulfidooxidans]OLZ12162.1 heterodisulfide reductase subunit C [Sulfobacillus thermosulfidooxidans]OLZ13058.1 heterodisulfide reductase subunit C [Sulfobacillus thermosulfidooxidans]OLZ21438.1 heterodisulfide reductase subunit C [Sulfobacillus thermosulfidooxidans]